MTDIRTKMLDLSVKANLNVKILFGKVTYLSDREIRIMSVSGHV